MDYLLLAIYQYGNIGIYLSSDELIPRYKSKGWTVWKVYPDGRKEEV